MRERQAVHDQLERIFSTYYDKEKRYEQLRRALESDDYPLPDPMMVSCFLDWMKSNRSVWPFPGGRVQQPQWVIDVFRTLEWMDEFYQLKADIVKESTAPLMEDMKWG